MNQAALDVGHVLQSLIELLSAIEHERWSKWQNYLHSQCAQQSDGSLVIPADLVDRWSKQAMTIYSDLSEREKQSDREQVLQYLPLIEQALLGQVSPSSLYGE